jgi:hypothetical protein
LSVKPAVNSVFLHNLIQHSEDGNRDRLISKPLERTYEFKAVIVISSGHNTPSATEKYYEAPLVLAVNPGISAVLTMAFAGSAGSILISYNLRTNSACLYLYSYANLSL